MFRLDRSLATIRPKQAFQDWLRGFDVPEHAVPPMEELRVDCTAVVVPTEDQCDEQEAYLDSVYRDLAQYEFARWSDDQEKWPEVHDYVTFSKWFELDLHATILDLDGDPIPKKELPVSPAEWVEDEWNDDDDE